MGLESETDEMPESLHSSSLQPQDIDKERYIFKLYQRQ